MQVISLLLLALGTSALPTTVDTTTNTTSASHPNNLEARWHWPWIGNSASHCKTSELVGPRPEIKGKCIPFQPTTSAVSVFWGTGAYLLDEIIVYENDGCRGATLKILKPTMESDGFGPEPYSCFGVSANDRKKWKSVTWN